MKSPHSIPDRRRKPARKPGEVDPEVLLTEELDFIPLYVQIEEQVRKLRTLETALHRAGRSAGFGRRLSDQSADQSLRERDFYFINRSRYLVPIAVRLKLQAGELCYLKAPASWRRVSEKQISPEWLPDPALPTKHLSIRRNGETPNYPGTVAGIKLVDGNFYLTNRRLILTNRSKRRLSIDLRSVYCRAVYRNAIEIHHTDKNGGRTCCDVLHIPEFDILLADSLFQSLGG